MLQSKALQQLEYQSSGPASQARSVSYMYVTLPACYHRWTCTISKQSPSTPSATSSWQAMTPFSWKSPGFWHHRGTELRNRLCVTLLKVIFFYYPSLLATILSLFACYPIDPATPGSELYPQYAQVRKSMSHQCCQCHASSGCIYLHHRQASNFVLHLSVTCLWFVTCTPSLKSQLERGCTVSSV